MLRVLWPNLKINTQEQMLFSGHLHSYLLDINFVLVIYWIYEMTSSPWIISQLQEKSLTEGGVADELTKQIHRVAKNVEGNCNKVYTPYL